MDFDNLEELSENSIIDMYNNIIEAEENPMLACICYCNGRKGADLHPSQHCGAYDGTVIFNPNCLYDCRSFCTGAYQCTCTAHYLNLYWDPACYT